MSRVLLATGILLLVLSPAVAQRGAHGGGGGRAAAPAFRGGMRTGAGRPMVGPRVTGVRPFGGFGSVRFGRPFRDGRFHRGRFFGNSFFFGFPYAYSYYPFGWDWYDYSQSNSTQDNSQLEPLYNQINDLSNRVEQLQNDNAQLNYQLNRQQSAPQAQPQAQPQPSAIVLPATVLVFKDGHRADVNNYAIVGKTLWVLSTPQAVRIPLSQLNLPETEKVNADNGVEFHPPKDNG